MTPGMSLQVRVTIVTNNIHPSVLHQGNQYPRNRVGLGKHTKSNWICVPSFVLKFCSRQLHLEAWTADRRTTCAILGRAAYQRQVPFATWVMSTADLASQMRRARRASLLTGRADRHKCMSTHTWFDEHTPLANESRFANICRRKTRTCH